MSSAPIVVMSGHGRHDGTASVVAVAEPPELVALLDLAERLRIEGWSLRAALVRYGQPEAVRSSRVMETVRRIEWALKPHMKVLAKDGIAQWEAMQAGVDDEIPGLLRVAQKLDQLGDQLARWAVNREGERPTSLVDEELDGIDANLARLGIGREEREMPKGARSRG